MVVALVMSFVGVLIFAQPAMPVKDGNLGAGGEVHSSPDVYPNGVIIGDQNNIWISGTIPVGSNQGSWRNRTGRTIFIDRAEIFTSGTASSTMVFSVGTSSAATVADFTNTFSTLIDRYTLATSSVFRLVNSIKDAGTNGRNVIPVTDGQYVSVVWRTENNQACTGAVCETATSTNRGFGSVDWKLRGHYKP